MYTKCLSSVLTLATAALALGYVGPASAANCEKNPTHPSCDDGQVPGGGGGTEGGGKFIATIGVNTGVAEVTGSSGDDRWNGGPKGIGGNSNDGVIETTVIDLSGLLDGTIFPNGSEIANGSQCFFGLSYNPSQVTVREGKRGTAEAWFWFTASANDETGAPTPARYLFQMFGAFPEGTVWPPAAVDDYSEMKLNTWEMRLENGQTSLKDGACTDESVAGDGFDVTIGVTRVAAPEPE